MAVQWKQSTAALNCHFSLTSSSSEKAITDEEEELNQRTSSSCMVEIKRHHCVQYNLVFFFFLLPFFSKVSARSISAFFSSLLVVKSWLWSGASRHWRLSSLRERQWPRNVKALALEAFSLMETVVPFLHFFLKRSVRSKIHLPEPWLAKSRGYR